MKRTLALLFLAAAATCALNACVVVPAGGYYYDHPHYRPYYRGY